MATDGALLSTSWAHGHGHGHGHGHYSRHMNDDDSEDGRAVFQLPVRPMSVSTCDYPGPVPVVRERAAAAAPPSPRPSPHRADAGAPRSLPLRPSSATYRDVLASNNIHMMPRWEDGVMPGHVRRLVESVLATGGGGVAVPGPDMREVLRRFEPIFQRAAQHKVEWFFRTHVFPELAMQDTLEWTARQPMSLRAVPYADATVAVGAGSAAGAQGAQHAPPPRFAAPAPDLLYGYNVDTAFSQPQKAWLRDVAREAEMAATGEVNAPVLPFFTMRFEGDDGDTTAATNDCLAAGATCVSIAESLGQQLRKDLLRAQHRHAAGAGGARSAGASPPAVHTAAPYSIAFGAVSQGNDTRLYVSWKHDDFHYHTVNIQSYGLRKPEHFVAFRSAVCNILHWGRTQRLQAIKASLDAMFAEEQRQAATKAREDLHWRVSKFMSHDKNRRVQSAA